MLAELADEFVDLLAFELSTFSLDFFLLSQVIPIILGITQFTQQRQLSWLMAAGKHAVQRIVILGWDWVEFMVMTARTTDREPECTTTDYIDSIVDDVVLVVQKTTSER